MKELLLQFATYNAWANTKLGETIFNLSEEQQLQLITSSFAGIKPTLLHIWDAENMWWQRMKLTENIIRPSEQSDYSIKEVLSNLNQQDRQWIEWITDATPAAIDHVFSYQNTKREQFKQPVFQMLLHVFNHSTSHRGQLVTMLRQLGIDKIPATDFIVWSRRK